MKIGMYFTICRYTNFTTFLPLQQGKQEKASVQERLFNLLDEAGEIGRSVATREAPYRTGRLSRSIDVERSGAAVEIKPNVPYARYQDPEYLRRGYEAMASFLRSRGFN